MKLCNNCGHQNPDTNAFCSECGSPLPAAEQQTQSQAQQQPQQEFNQFQGGQVNQLPPQDYISQAQPVKQKKNRSNAAIILALIFFFPLGLYWMWARSDWKKGVKIAITVIIALIFIGSVSSDDSNNENISAPTTEITTVEETSSNILMNSEVKTADVMNGVGTKKIGTRAYVEVSSEQFENLTPENYFEFASEKVDNSGYNWFSVISDNGIGAQWAACYIGILEIGAIDDEGIIETVTTAYQIKDDNYIDITEEYLSELADEETTTETTTESTTKETTTKEKTTIKNTTTYIVNTNTGKFHLPYCSSASNISSSNRKEVDGTYDELVNRGYSPCKKCLG